jgi:ribonuclease HII
MRAYDSGAARVSVGFVAGLDEVGRGALAGPVIAAAVVFDPSSEPIEGLDDSKRLSPMRRAELLVAITSRARAWAVGRAEASEVDRLNVLTASMLAMRRAFLSLDETADWVCVDGNRFPSVDCPGEAIVGGDATVPEIMAASILAKVFRDREMAVLDALYPHYGFARHKGYPTALHKDRLAEWGPCPLHRMSFTPVKAAVGRL